MVLLIMGILITITATTTSTVINQKRRNETQEKMKAIDAAIANFVTLNKRLPCPADGTLNAVAGTANSGAESCTTLMSANQANGVAPWTTLGITLADATDGWGNVFTYRVDSKSINPGSMDLTLCTGAGASVTAITTTAASPSTTVYACDSSCTSAGFPTACTATTTSLANRGLRIFNLAGATLAEPSSSTGAAYALISHGENLEGAYGPGGVLVSNGNPTSGTQEQLNFASAAYNTASTATHLVDDLPSYGATTGHFDDFVSHPSLLTVATKATLGPRPY